MRSDTKKLARLVKLQRQVEQMHAARQTQLLAEKIVAENEAAHLIAQANKGGSTADLFPDLYYRHINACSALGAEKGEAASIEANSRTIVRRRAERLEEKLLQSRRSDDRKREERDNLERIQAASFKQV